jgi:hypothetical protein
MGYPVQPPMPYPPRPGRPPASAADVTISIVTLVLTVVLGAVATFFGVFSLAFIDYCPPESCSAEGAAIAVMTALAVAGLIGLIGMVLTIVALARRKLAWPFAVGTLGLCVVTLFVGALGYMTAVGA